MINKPAHGSCSVGGFSAATPGGAAVSEYDVSGSLYTVSGHSNMDGFSSFSLFAGFGVDTSGYP